ncbi:hypothetical protein [Amphibiibacter pelophylacis]|uniref:hypothetical protein n=1 Tax=Amphibiibacter pelophylacis TaxID=1799477 RepID=UPI003BFA7337
MGTAPAGEGLNAMAAPATTRRDTPQPGQMRIQSREALEEVRAQCLGMVRQRAATSGGSALIPVPGADIVADVALLMELLPAINRAFGLAPEQIALLAPTLQTQLRAQLGDGARPLVGQTITRSLVLAVLKQMAVRLAARQVLKWVPVAGQATAAVMAAWALHQIGKRHVNDCCSVIEALLPQPTSGGGEVIDL